MGSHNETSPYPPSVLCLQSEQLHLGHLVPGGLEARLPFPESPQGCEPIYSPFSSANSSSFPSQADKLWGPLCPRT